MRSSCARRACCRPPTALPPWARQAGVRPPARRRRSWSSRSGERGARPCRPRWGWRSSAARRAAKDDCPDIISTSCRPSGCAAPERKSACIALRHGRPTPMPSTGLHALPNEARPYPAHPGKGGSRGAIDRIARPRRELAVEETVGRLTLVRLDDSRRA
jgi:hypothetical protein